MSKINYFTASYSDEGERNNEDSLLIRNYKANFFLVIADGVGGLEAGELASGFVTNSFNRWFNDIAGNIPNIETGDMMGELEDHIYMIHENLCDIAAERGKKFGSTVTAVLTTKNEYIAAQVGDSRAYLLNGSEISQITADQTVAEYERTTGNKLDYVEEEKKEHTLLQCVGTGKITPQITTGHLKPEFALLLCSDGLSNTLSIEEAKRFMGQNIASKDILKQMTQQARDRNESDNITSILLRRIIKPDDKKK